MHEKTTHLCLVPYSLENTSPPPFSHFFGYKLMIVLSRIELTASLSLKKQSICPKGTGGQGQRKGGEKERKKRGQHGKQLRYLERGLGPSGDGELAWGSRALRACVFVFLIGHCSSKAEPRPSLGNDAASHNRLQ